MDERAAGERTAAVLVFRSPEKGMQLTIEETQMLVAVWTNAERVDWAVYDRLRARVLAWARPL